MKKILESLGFTDVPLVKPYNYNIQHYDLSTQSDKIKAHREFLKSAIDEENNRLIAIESKTSQLVSQTSVVFSLLSLTIPIIIDKTEGAHIALKIVLILFVLIAFFFYFLAIFNALKNFNVKNFSYAVASPNNVIQLKDDSVEKFEAELVRDYLYSININISVNDKKATNLLHSNTAFKYGNIATACIVVLISFMVLFISKNDEKIIIEPNGKISIPSQENVQLKVIDTVVIHDTLRIKDTVIVKDTVYVQRKWERQ